MSLVAKRMRGLMKNKGWTMNYTAKMADLPLATIRSIIYGQSKNQKQDTLFKLAKAFQCSIDDLTGNININNDNLAHDSVYNTELVFNCLEAVENFQEKKNIKLERSKIIHVVDQMVSLCITKARNGQQIELDDAIIEWLINNK